MPKKKSNKKTQKQKQKQTVSQKVTINLSKPKRANRRRSQPPTREISVPQMIYQYLPIQNGSNVPSIVKYYNNIMTPSAKTEPVKDLQQVREQQQVREIQQVREQQQEDYTTAIRQSVQQEDLRETQQANAGIIPSLVAEQDDTDLMKEAIIKQAETHDKPKKEKKKIIEMYKNIGFSESDRPAEGAGAGAGAGARRGRPSGSKNKPKEIKEQERLKKQAKREARAKRREAGYTTENPQTDYEDY
jgi:hypothetical protein